MDQLRGFYPQYCTRSEFKMESGWHFTMESNLYNILQNEKIKVSADMISQYIDTRIGIGVINSETRAISIAVPCI